MTHIKEDIKDGVETAKDVAHDVEQEIETVAHNTVHPKDETDAQARRRQPFMPIVGAALVAIILFICYAIFFN